MIDENGKINLEKQQRKSSEELQKLTSYHWKRRQAAQEEAEKMLKYAYALQQMKDQMERNEQMLRQDKKIS